MSKNQGKLGTGSLSLMMAMTLVLIVIVSMAISLLPRASAASHAVDISNFSFSPNSITIAPGDSVTWTNNDGTTHTVTGVGWESGFLNNGNTYTHQFNTSGDFSYHCSIHTYMTGVIHVTSGNTTPPPTTSSKAFFSGTTLIAVIAVIIVAVIAVVVVLVRKRPAQKT